MSYTEVILASRPRARPWSLPLPCLPVGSQANSQSSWASVSPSVELLECSPRSHFSIISYKWRMRQRLTLSLTLFCFSCSLQHRPLVLFTVISLSSACHIIGAQ